MKKKEFENKKKYLNESISSRETSINEHYILINQLRLKNDVDRDLLKSIEDAYFFGSAPATERIMKYIEQCGYSWTLESLKKEYSNFINGFYISHTCKEIMTKFSNELESLFS